MKGGSYVRAPGPHLARGERKAQILAMLAKGPLTTREFADALNIHSVHVAVLLHAYRKSGLVASHPAFEGDAGKSLYALRRWTLAGAPVPPPDPLPPRAPKRKPKLAKRRKRGRAKPVRARKPPKPVKVRAVKPPKPVKPTRIERERASLARATATAALATIAASPAARPSREPETVDEFLARGGRIQQLGACEYVPAPSRPMRSLT